MYKMTLTWPPTKQHFVDYMNYELQQSDKKNVTALIYCDNPDIIIFDPLVHLIRCETQIGQANCGERTVKIIIGKED